VSGLGADAAAAPRTQAPAGVSGRLDGDAAAAPRAEALAGVSGRLDADAAAAPRAEKAPAGARVSGGAPCNDQLQGGT